jgi:hypothetical protein
MLKSTLGWMPNYLLLLQKIQKYNNTDCYHMKNKFKKIRISLISFTQK